MSERFCVCMYESLHTHVSLCINVVVLCIMCVGINAQMCDIHTKIRTHTRDTHIHTYTHPYRQDYVSGHSCVCLYESWYMYSYVFLHACFCIRALCIWCLCVNVQICDICICAHTLPQRRSCICFYECWCVYKWYLYVYGVNM